MVNESKFAEIKLVPSTPKTYEVRYLENKQSGLSPAAKAKVINKSGSNYLSPWADTDLGEAIGYGPTEEKKVEVAWSKGCSNPSTFEVNIFLEGDYVLASSDGKTFVYPRVASGKIKDQDFSEIRKTINELKSGEIKVWKGRGTKTTAKRERTEECIKYEGYFEAKLEEAIEEIKKKPHYGNCCHAFTYTRP